MLQPIRMKMERLQNRGYSALLLRLGLGAVFALLGYNKLPHPENWLVYITPQISHLFPWSPYEFLKLQGIAEFLLGCALMIGFVTRACAFLSAVILALIIFFVWPDFGAVRDIGLLSVSLSLVISGGGRWSMDEFLKKESPP